MFSMDDTIVAVSSAAGPAGRSIVRLSGPEAIRLAAGALSRPLDGIGGFRAIAGAVRASARPPVEVPGRLYLFRAPRSYTRQDVAELHVAGQAVASMLCSTLIAAGARQAQAGEFTARAFFTGRLDLARAEAVADLIDAEADAQLRSALGVLEGALSRLCRPAAEAVTEALALIEASIDFADEDVELPRPAQVAGALREVSRRLKSASAAGSSVARAGPPHAAIAGRPNAGKSSLLNALSGTDRAIVSALAGTTRDVLSAAAEMAEGCEVVLLDAAGLDVTADPLTRAAHAAAREAVASADAVVFVVDAAAADHDAEADLLAEVRQLNRRAAPLLVANKTDLPTDPADLARRFGPGLLPVSALTGAGLDRLRAALAERLADLAPPRPAGLLLHDRQRRRLADAAAAATAAAELLAPAGGLADVAELAAVELRAALAGLKELTGEVVTEDVLAAIFGRFCIGK